MAWGERRKHVIVGGNAVIHILKLHKVPKNQSFDDLGSATSKAGAYTRSLQSSA